MGAISSCTPLIYGERKAANTRIYQFDTSDSAGNINSSGSNDETNSSGNGKNQAYWEALFQKTIEHNKNGGYTGWSIK